MENVGIFDCNLEYFTAILVYFMAIWQCCGNLVNVHQFW
jgi:hypothetical protein